MPIVSLGSANPFIDGRQSDRAMTIRLGVERYFAELNWATLPELTLKGGRRADLVALSPKGEVCIVEIKSSIADFRADNKWPEYKEFCDQLFFATLADVPVDIFPQDAGFMVADAYGAEIIRDAAPLSVNAAKRKDIHLRFARSGSQRLARCCAHAGIDVAQFRDD